LGLAYGVGKKAYAFINDQINDIGDIPNDLEDAISRERKLAELNAKDKLTGREKRIKRNLEEQKDFDTVAAASLKEANAEITALEDEIAKNKALVNDPTASNLVEKRISINGKREFITEVDAANMRIETANEELALRRRQVDSINSLVSRRSGDSQLRVENVEPKPVAQLDKPKYETMADPSNLEKKTNDVMTVSQGGSSGGGFTYVDAKNLSPQYITSNNRGGTNISTSTVLGGGKGGFGGNFNPFPHLPNALN
jgi:hypothetical protein